MEIGDEHQMQQPMYFIPFTNEGDGGGRGWPERAGEAERSKGRKRKTEQKNVQSGMNGVKSSGSSPLGGELFFRWWKMARKCDRVEVL